MSVTDALVANNEEYAARLDREPLEAAPALGLAVVACMDCRLDPFAALGLGDGEAHVIRNAGGIVTDDVLRSLAISQRKLGTREIVLLHHTKCGMEGLDEESLRSELEADSGEQLPFELGAFGDVADSVRRSIRRIVASPLLPETDAVRGFVFDVDTGRVEEIEPAER